MFWGRVALFQSCQQKFHAEVERTMTEAEVASYEQDLLRPSSYYAKLLSECTILSRNTIVSIEKQRHPRSPWIHL
jgi:pantothenate kinase-related protein Tda10